MATSRIKKGDTVRVIAGKQVTKKVKEGKVRSIKDGKVVVEGLNMIKKHTKPSQSNPNGGIIEVEAPIDISNVMYVHKGEVARIQYRFENGEKVRYAKVRGKDAERI